MLLGCLLLSAGAWPQESAAPATQPSDAAIQRDIRVCRAHRNLEACYDAIRWQPKDPALQIALGDALLAAKRPGDALRAYRRAHEISPSLPGIDAKISSAEAKLSPPSATQDQSNTVAAKRYSNAEPEANSH
jgi:cytochrome c-type biogenesis protein CcmH/NrfG